MTEVNVAFRVMTEADREEVDRLMDKVFFREEIICRSLGFVTPGETRAYNDNFFPLCMESQLGIVAVDERQQRIVGVTLNIVTSPEKPNDIVFSHTDEQTKKLAAMDCVYDPLYDGMEENFYSRYGVSQLVANRGLCVDPTHRRLGIATELLKRSIQLVRDKGFPCYLVEATSSYTRAMLDHLGFDNVIEKPYTELLVGGRQIVTDTNVHHSLSIHGLKL